MEAAGTNPATRRILRRRRTGGGGFSASVSTRSESLREPEQEQDEVDDAIDPEQVRQGIRTGAITPVTPTPAGTPPPRDNPRLRLDAVGQAGSSSFAKEYRMNLLHRLLMRNIPLDQIARELGVSISTVEKDRAELKKKLREAATQLNIDEMVGGQNAFYDEVAGLALRVASSGARTDENGNRIEAVPTAMKLAAMRTALAANADRTRFNASAGVFDVLKFRRAEDGSSVSDVQQLMLRTLELMSNLGDDAPTDNFKPMSFDDIDASESQSEIQEL